MKTIWPGQAGAIKLARRYGEALVCVRYRCSADGRSRRTTVELLVDETPIRPRVWVKVRLPASANRAPLRAEAQARGAIWDPRTRVWLMPRAVARALGLAPYTRRPHSAE